MDPLWREFRASPGAYLASRAITNQTLVDELLQLLTSSTDKNDVAKLAALGIFQEMAPTIFSEPSRLETTVATLKTVFQQQRTTGSPLICSQILCTMTSVLIELEELLETDYLLLELVHLLFDVIEKTKSDSNLVLRSTACGCLTELELAYPGLLSSKVGHFYSMCQAEDFHIFQNYLLLLATVLEHTLLRYLQAVEQDQSPDFSLSDLLSHAEPLKSYSLPEDFHAQAKQLLTEPPGAVVGEEGDWGDVRRGVSFILDYRQLLTPPCLAMVLRKVLSMVSLSSLGPRMLKSFLLHYTSCQDLICFHIVLMIKWKFGGEICDKGDEESIDKWLTVEACHPALPSHHREFLLSLYLYLSQEMLIRDKEEEEGDTQWIRISSPSVFDSYDTYYYKVKALNFQLGETEVFSQSLLPLLFSTVLKQVQYGIGGAPIVTLFRLLYAYYSTCPYSVPNTDDICKLVVDVIKDHPKFIPHTIDFIRVIQASFPDSPLPLQLLADYLHHLSSSSISLLLPHLPLYLLFVEQTAMHTLINPLVVIRFLSGVLRSLSQAELVSWENGSTILGIVNTVMRKHHTDTVFKELTDLLEMMVSSYSDIDVQDRARFYHQLLLTVSGEKLSSIIALASDNSTGSTLSDIVEARITDNTYPSAPPVKVVEDKLLSLTRVGTKEDPYYHNEGTLGEADSSLRSYLGSLGEAGHPGLSFNLQYRIQFTHLPRGVPTCIYALVLKLSSNPSYYSSPDVYIPYLMFKDSEAPPTSSSKVITFTFLPKDPLPTTFNVRAIFTTEGGVTCVSDLGSVVVRFQDLFHPLPSAMKISASDMFEQLWADIEASQHPKSLSDRFGVLSTVHLETSRKDWERRAKPMLLHLVPTKDDSAELWYMVFLPPKYHLLMKLRFGEQGLSVRLATDCWRALERVNTYLHSVASSPVVR